MCMSFEVRNLERRCSSMSALTLTPCTVLVALVIIVYTAQIQAARLGGDLCDKCGKAIESDQVNSDCGHKFHASCVKGRAKDCVKCERKNALTCRICGNLIKSNKIILDCGHIFHQDCILEYKKSKCPTCNKAVMPNCGYCGNPVYTSEEGRPINGCEHVAHEQCLDFYGSRDTPCANCNPVERCKMCDGNLLYKIQTLNCGHSFHYRCLSQWDKRCCPLLGCKRSHEFEICAYCRLVILPDASAEPVDGCEHKMHTRCKRKMIEGDVCRICNRDKLINLHEQDRQRSDIFQRRASEDSRGRPMLNWSRNNSRASVGTMNGGSPFEPAINVGRLPERIAVAADSTMTRSPRYPPMEFSSLPSPKMPLPSPKAQPASPKDGQQSVRRTSRRGSRRRNAADVGSEPSPAKPAGKKEDDAGDKKKKRMSMFRKKKRGE